MNEKNLTTPPTSPALLDLLHAAALQVDPASQAGVLIASARRAIELDASLAPTQSPTPSHQTVDPSAPPRVALLAARAPSVDGSCFDLTVLLLRAEASADALRLESQTLGRRAVQALGCALGKPVECALFCFDTRAARAMALAPFAPLARWDLPDQTGLEAPALGFERVLTALDLCVRAVPPYDAHVYFEKLFSSRVAS